MRATTLGITLGLLAACGGSGSSPPPQNGGLTGAGPTGAVEGQTFTPMDGGALSVAPTFCSALSTNVTGLVVAFSSYPSFCPFKRQANVCGDHPSSTEAILLIARVGATAPPAIGSGTYAIGRTTSGGFTTAADVGLRRLGAACADLTAFQSVTGSITIDQVSPTVKGSVNATFWSGLGGTGTNLGTFSGGFDVGHCTLPLDLCGLMSGAACPTPACIP